MLPSAPPIFRPSAEHTCGAHVCVIVDAVTHTPAAVKRQGCTLDDAGVWKPPPIATRAPHSFLEVSHIGFGLSGPNSVPCLCLLTSFGVIMDDSLWMTHY